MTKLLICIVTLWLLSSYAYAQTDTEFWFVAPEVSSDHGDRPLTLRISTLNQPSYINISEPANPDFVPIALFIDSNSTQSVSLTAYLEQVENRPANQVLNKGLYIKATELIAVYYEVSSSVNPEIFPLKGKNALGLEFYVPSQNQYPNENGSEAIDIVASEDNTAVTITPTAKIEGYNAGETFTIQLNKGQTFSVRATNVLDAISLSGTHIVANKPVAVTASDDSIRDRDFWDLIGDQLVPVKLLGMEYIVIQGKATYEYVFIVATEDDTEILINGEKQNTIDQAETLKILLQTEVIHIQASKPIYVRQLTGYGGELADALIPPIGCTGSGQVGFVRSTDLSFDLMLLTQAGNQDGFLINGNSNIITGNSFKIVPGTNHQWVYAFLPMSLDQIPLDANLIQNTKGFFHMGILHEFGLSAVYGYFSSYNEYTGSNITLCPGGATVIDPGPQFETYLWNDGSTGQTLAVTEPGTYTLSVTFSNGCAATDTFHVYFAPTEVDLGNDSLLCEGEELLVQAEGFDTYTWTAQSQPSFTNRTPGIRVETPDTYIVTVTNPCGTFSDSITVNFTPLPAVELGEDFTVCDQNEITLDAGGNYANYRWQDGWDNRYYAATETGTYKVTVTVDACKVADSVSVKFGNAPKPFDLGEDDTICVHQEIPLEVKGNGYDHYKWYDGSTDPQKVVQGEGTYWAVASNECGEVRDEITFTAIKPENLYFINVFTPNDDGANEVFQLDEWLIGAQLLVYNRWGKLVYESASYQNNWHADELSTGIYYYEVKSDCLEQAFTGYFHILR